MEKTYRNYMISHNVLEIVHFSQKYKVAMLNYSLRIMTKS